MMQNDSARSVFEAVSANPKVAGAVAAGNVSMGTLVWFDKIHGMLSVVSLGVGIVTGLVILGIQLIRLEQAWRQRSKEQ